MSSSSDFDVGEGLAVAADDRQERCKPELRAHGIAVASDFQIAVRCFLVCASRLDEHGARCESVPFGFEALAFAHSFTRLFSGS